MEISNKYLELLESCHKFYDKYDISSENLDRLKNEIENFKVIVPIIGGFSSGKSSIINRLIGERLLAVNITPETAIPTEIMFGSENDFNLVDSNNNKRNISLDELKTGNFDISSTTTLEVKSNRESLKKFDKIKIVDMPGLDSGIEAHNIAIDKYLHKSLAYIITIDVEQGIRASLIEFLKELKLYDMPVECFLTKCDKKTESDIKLIRADVERKINATLGTNNIKVRTTSARKKDFHSLENFLEEINSKADDIFAKKIGAKLKQNINYLISYLETSLKSKDYSIDEIREEKEDLTKSLEVLKQEIDAETLRFEENITSGIDGVMQGLASKLNGSVDSLTADIVAKRKIEGKINSIVRKVLAEEIKNEIEPRFHRYIDKMNGVIKDNLELDLNVEFNQDNTEIEKLVKGGVLAVLPLIIGSIGGPIGLIITAVATLCVELFMSKRKKENMKREVASELEDDIIPRIISDVRSLLNDVIIKQINDVKAEIEKAANESINIKEKALIDLTNRLEEESENARAREVEMNQDLVKVKEIKNGIRL